MACTLDEWTRAGHCPNPACYLGYAENNKAFTAWEEAREQARAAAYERISASGATVAFGARDALIAQWLRDNPQPRLTRSGERNTIYKLYLARNSK